MGKRAPRLEPSPGRPGRSPARVRARPRSRVEQSRELALLVARAGLSKKATAVEIVDLSGKVEYTDYLVLMTGRSDRHVGAIADYIEECSRQQGLSPISVEGRAHASWVLLDFVDVVAHVFLPETRALYDLDGLWMDAGRIAVPGAR